MKPATGVLAAILVLFTPQAGAEKIAHSEGNGVVFSLYDDKCQLEAVSNLPKRATWAEKGVTHEGCYALHPAGLVVAYFADRTVVLAPTRVFRQVVAI